MSKYTYSSIEPNAERQEPAFLTYIKFVQSEKITPEQKDLVAKEMKKEEKLTEEENKKLEEIKKILSKNAAGSTPLYAKDSYADSFILNPKKTFKAFDRKKDLSLINMELNYLTFRMFYIEYANKLDPKAKSFSVMSQEDFKKFLEMNFTSKKDGDIFTYENVNKTPVLVHADFNDSLKNYSEIYKPFNEIVLTMINNAKSGKGFFEQGQDKYKIVVNDTAVMDNMISIFKTLKFGNLFSENLTDDEIKSYINGFFTEVALIKPSILSSHILNRMHTYFLMAYPYLCTEEQLKTSGDGEEYSKLISDIEEVDSKIKSDPSLEKDLTAKKKILVKKMNTFRLKKIYDYFSYLIAMNLPAGNTYLTPENDNRIFFFKYFSYPGVYTQKTGDEEFFQTLNDVISKSS